MEEQHAMSPAIQKVTRVYTDAATPQKLNSQVFESLHKFHVNGTRTKDLNVF
jgi:hypothetical protein